MAQITLDGLQAIDKMFAELKDIPSDVTFEAIDAMATIAGALVRKSGEAMGVRDPESNVHILDNITHTKPKTTPSGGYSDITFSGTRTRGRIKTRNAEIASYNELGRRGQAPRPFIRTALETGAAQISAAGEKIIGEWFEKTAQG